MNIEKAKLILLSLISQTFKRDMNLSSSDVENVLLFALTDLKSQRTFEMVQDFEKENGELKEKLAEFMREEAASKE